MPLFIALVLISFAIFFVNRQEILEEREQARKEQYKEQKRQAYNEAIGCYEEYQTPLINVPIDPRVGFGYQSGAEIKIPIGSDTTVYFNFSNKNLNIQFTKGIN